MQAILKEYIKDSLFTHVQVLPEKNSPSYWVEADQIYNFERVKLHLNNRHFLMTDYDTPLVNAHKLYDIEPNFVIYNPIKCTHQAFWLLAAPVHCQNKESWAYRYLRAIESGYDFKYHCDFNFQREIHRNPLFYGSDIEFLNLNRHTLKELAEVIELNNAIPDVEKKRCDDAEGRNCALFDELRVWAYKQIKTLSKCDFEAFTAQLTIRANRLNTFPTPLPATEIKSIAKSISRFCIERLDNHAKFSAKQARRGAIGGKISKGGGRPKNLNMELWESIHVKKKEGYPNRVIAEELSISASTVSKYLKREK